MQPSIFVSYRREDSEHAAGRLRLSLLSQFGDEAIFMDTSSIQAGEEWPSRIKSALDSAKAVIAVIGRDWVRVSDEWGQRRIDEENDWVRKEIEQALAQNKEVIPVLVSEGRMPPADKLPRSISALPEKQAMSIRSSYWDHDIKLLLSRLEFLGETPLARQLVGPYPGGPVMPVPVSDENLEILLRGILSQWRKVVSPDPENLDIVRTELFRNFEFKSFSDAIHFISAVAPGFDIANHHPRWENVWRTLRVYLHSWDIGNLISDKDIQLARYLDQAYSDFAAEGRKDLRADDFGVKSDL